MFFQRYILVTVFLLLNCFAGSTLAAFNLSGSVITQTGTDTDLSGLAGVSGVTVTSQQGIDIYNIGDRRLVIQGTLTIDPELESLVIGYDNGELLVVNGSGHLIIGQEIIQNGFSRFSEGMAIFLEDTPAGFIDRVSFEGNSSFTWNGGVISMYAGKFGFYNDNVTVRINSKNANLIYRTQDPQNQIRQETDDFISQGFSFINGDFTIVGTGQQLDGYEPTHATGSIAFSVATPNVDVTLRDYAGGDRGNEKDIKLWQGGRPILINSKTGSELNLGAHIDGQANAYGVALIYQELDLRTLDLSNTPIENARVFIRDTDNGNRETYNRESHIVDNTADNVYSVTTGGDGRIATQSILLGANVANSGNGDAVNTGNYAWDYRGNNNDNSDLFDLHIWSYNHLYQALPDTELKGVGGTSIDTKLLSDPDITESDVATVNSYTEINTLERLYDRAKAWKVEAANVEYPAINFQVMDGDGSNINLGSKDLIVDGTAGSAFDINTGTNTITINAGTMDCTGDNFTSLETTGTVSFVNGASPGTCIFTDSVGTNGVLTLTGLDTATVLVYDDDSAGDDTISYQTNQTGDIEIPFSATSSTDFQVVVRRQGYSEVNFSFDPSSGGFFEFPIAQFRSLTIEGTPIYQSSGDSGKITMDYSGQRINIGDFTIAGQEFYDTIQDYEVTENAMKFPRIVNFDGDDRLLLLNSYQIRNRDGGAAVPGVNAFVFAESGSVLDASNGSVQFLFDGGVIDRQEQLVKMLEMIQGSSWDEVGEDFTTPDRDLVNMIGTGFDPAEDSLSQQIDTMFARGIVDVNVLKDLIE